MRRRTKQTSDGAAVGGISDWKVRKQRLPKWEMRGTTFVQLQVIRYL